MIQKRIISSTLQSTINHFSKHIPIRSFSHFLMILLIAGCSPTENKSGPPKPPRGYANETLLKAAILGKMLDIVNTKPDIPETITEYKDITYKKVGDRSLKLDIYQPKNLNHPVPVLIFIHGGAWKGGNKSDYLLYLIDFAKQGYVTATLSYRFSREAIFPAAVRDVKCAVRWIRAHAKEYNIDADNIAVIGGSAGGHLAMMIGYSSDNPEFDGECEQDSVSSRVQAVVNLYGPSDLTTDFAIKQGVLVDFMGAPFSEAPEIYKKASPITWISKDDPPTLIFQGTIDSTVPVRQSDILKEKLDQTGVINEYHRLEGWPHTMDLAQSVNEYCQYYMNAFFQKYIPLPPDSH